MTKVLLVDDSKFLRLATERALARAGYDVSTAVDGENALQLAREKRPDLILLDMLLPKMTGPDVLKALKEKSADCFDRRRGADRAVAQKRRAAATGRCGGIPRRSPTSRWTKVLKRCRRRWRRSSGS
jgi:CheY-like chemotaxis protein